MASSSCALALRRAALTRESHTFFDQRGGLCHRMGVNLTMQRQRRMVAHAAAVTFSSPGMKLSLTKSQPALESATVAYANKTAEEERNRVTPEKLDQWVKESIVEIVRNIGREPSLINLFSVSSRASAVRVERETALPESWPRIKKRWERESRTPDAVILVEEFGARHGDGEETIPSAGVAARHGATRTWGLVVQGRGMDCAACYILNTTRVMSSVGFCTHFCLVRAKCFGESADVQLRNAWLQGR